MNLTQFDANFRLFDLYSIKGFHPTLDALGIKSYFHFFLLLTIFEATSWNLIKWSCLNFSTFYMKKPFACKIFRIGSYIYIDMEFTISFYWYCQCNSLELNQNQIVLIQFRISTFVPLDGRTPVRRKDEISTFHRIQSTPLSMVWF